jgi:fructuronate reductase/mannitol 2-dehydrogenase
MPDADFHTFIGRLMDDEIAPLLLPVPGIDLPGYQRTLLQRFANPKIADQVARICTDGSDRMPKFLLPSLAEALDQGTAHRLLTLAVAGWIRYLRGVDEDGHPIAIADRLANELRERASAGGADPRPILGLRGIFGDLGDNETFVSELAATLRELDARGAKVTVSACLGTPS